MLLSGAKINGANKKYFTALIILAFCQKSLFEFITNALGKLPIISLVTPAIIPIAYVFLVVLSIGEMHIKTRFLDAIIVLSFAMSLIFTAFLYPQNWEYIKNVFWIDIFPCIPFFILGLHLVFDEHILSKLSLWSKIAIVATIAYLFYYQWTGRAVAEDNMGWAYRVLPNIMIVCIDAFYTKKFSSIIFAIVGGAFILSLGTRGPVVVLFVYAIFLLFQNVDLRSWKKKLGLVLVCAAILVVITTPLLYAVAETMGQLFSTLGFSTRVTDSLINESLLDSSSRDIIYETLAAKIQENPIRGYGIYGEWPMGFATAHNIYLEILIHFGVIGGSFLLAFFLITPIRGYFVSQTKIEKSWIALWFIFTFVQGVFGGSYLRYNMFLLLGTALFAIRKYRNRKMSLGNEVN